MAILYTVCIVVRVYVLFCFAFLAIFHVIMPGSSEDGSNKNMETKGAAFELAMDYLGPRLKRVLMCTCDQVGKSTYVRKTFVILNK